MRLSEKWQKWMGAGNAAQQLRSYPQYRAPFAGPARNLSLDAAQANLQYLLSNRSERLAIITSYLTESGIDVASMSTGSDCRPLLQAIHRWAAQEWPDFYNPAIAKHEIWLASSRAGPEIVYSLLMDVAIFFGDLIVMRRPQYTWSLDLDPVNEADDMVSFKRPVVQIPKGGPFPAPIIFDLENIVVSCYFRCKSSLFARIDELTRPVTDAISGAHEEYWLSQQPAPK